jgi:hypothetical protein
MNPNATQQKAAECFDALQNLELKPTPKNTSILSGVFQLLREIYHELGECENAGNTGTENGSAVDTVGRDND